MLSERQGAPCPTVRSGGISCFQFVVNEEFNAVDAERLLMRIRFNGDTSNDDRLVDIENSFIHDVEAVSGFDDND